MTAGQYPTITRGMGNLTPQLWERLMAMLAIFEKNNRDETRRRSRRGGGTATNSFLAKITGNAEITVNRYKYAWTEVIVDGDDPTEFIDKTDGKTGTTSTDYALNGCEASNTEYDVGSGVELDGEDYPTGFSMMAIGQLFSDAGDKIGVVVVMFEFADDDGSVRYLFNLVNSHDGECDE